MWKVDTVGQPPWAPIAYGIGAMTVRNARIAPVPSAAAFVFDRQGHLWMATPLPAGGWEWSHIKGGATEAVGVVAVNDLPDYTRPYVFVRLGQNLQLYWWHDAKWVPADLGMPPGTTVAEGIGAVALTLGRDSVGQPLAVVRGADRNLWVRRWDNVHLQWLWTKLGRPADASLIYKIGLTAFPDPKTGYERLHVYMQGSDASVWECVSDMVTTEWINRGRPPAPTLAGIGVTTAETADGTATAIYAFVTVAGLASVYALVVDAHGATWVPSATPPEGANAGLGAAHALVTQGLDVQAAPGSGILPLALLRGYDEEVWADQSGLRGEWTLSKVIVPRELEDVVVEQVGATLVRQPSGAVETHVFLPTRDGVLYEAVYQDSPARP